MKLRCLFSLIAGVVATPALAWSGSTISGDYRFTATLADHDGRLQSASLASDRTAEMRAMQLHAWFIDSEGGILASARLSTPTASGVVLVALGEGGKIPSNATALVVVAQPVGLTGISTAAAPALVAQIALP